jgi:hypothetical protein
MNIFASSTCPIQSAINLDTKRQIKMATESVQILSSVLRNYYNVDDIDLYKKTHVKHPCVIWASKNQSNFEWLIEHAQALANEYTKKYHKTHKASLKLSTIKKYINVLPQGQLTKFANCTQDPKLKLNFQHLNDPHQAYDLYVKGKIGKLSESEMLLNNWKD